MVYLSSGTYALSLTSEKDHLPNLSDTALVTNDKSPYILRCNIDYILFSTWKYKDFLNEFWTFIYICNSIHRTLVFING